MSDQVSGADVGSGEEEPAHDRDISSAVPNVYDPEVISQTQGREPRVLASFEQRYEGPLPPPEDAERYEALLAGTFDRILTMVEDEQSARHKLQAQEHQDQVALQRQYLRDVADTEANLVKSLNRRELAGMALGFILALCVLGIAALIILTDRSVEAGVALIVADAAVIAGAFLVSRRPGNMSADRGEAK